MCWANVHIYWSIKLWKIIKNTFTSNIRNNKITAQKIKTYQCDVKWLQHGTHYFSTKRPQRGSLKSCIVWHLLKISNLVFFHSVVMNPSATFPETVVDAIFPNSSWKINLTFPCPKIKNGRHDNFVADGKFIGDGMTGGIVRIQHPKGTNQGKPRRQRHACKFLEQGCYL